MAVVPLLLAVSPLFTVAVCALAHIERRCTPLPAAEPSKQDLIIAAGTALFNPWPNIWLTRTKAGRGYARHFALMRASARKAPSAGSTISAAIEALR